MIAFLELHCVRGACQKKAPRPARDAAGARPEKRSGSGAGMAERPFALWSDLDLNLARHANPDAASLSSFEPAEFGIAPIRRWGQLTRRCLVPRRRFGPNSDLE
jgi:hypothetical protein